MSTPTGIDPAVTNFQNRPFLPDFIGEQVAGLPMTKIILSAVAALAFAAINLSPLLAQDLSPEEMEAALAAEDARQSALQAAADGMSAPYAKFEAAFEETMALRLDAAAARVKALLAEDGCNLNGLQTLLYAPEQLVHSAALIEGRDTLEDLRAQTSDAGIIVADLPVDAPPAVTDAILAVISTASARIEAINAGYVALCTESEGIMSQLSMADAEQMMAVSANLQHAEETLSQEVDEIILEMNNQIDAVDEELVGWLLEPMRNAI